jgi:hypothetical protein
MSIKEPNTTKHGIANNKSGELGICFPQVIAVGEGAVNCTSVSAAGGPDVAP